MLGTLFGRFEISYYFDDELLLCDWEAGVGGSVVLIKLRVYLVADSWESQNSLTSQWHTRTDIFTTLKRCHVCCEPMLKRVPTTIRKAAAGVVEPWCSWSILHLEPTCTSRADTMRSSLLFNLISLQAY